MKKQNRNIFAYTRSPKLNKQTKTNNTNKTQTKTTNQSIYQTIMDQMDINQCQYINKLILKEQNKDRMPGKKKQNIAHERTKSYANIMIGNLAKTDYCSKDEKQNKEIAMIKKQLTKSTNNFYSYQPSPKKRQNIESSFNIHSKISGDRSFLFNLDQYISILSPKEENMAKQSRFKEINSEQKEQNKVYKELRDAEKKVKQLKLHLHFMKKQEQKYTHKNNVLKEQVYSMKNYIESIMEDLQNERFQRIKMQQFFMDFEKKFHRIHPQRKTIGQHRRIIKNYDDTEQSQEVIYRPKWNHSKRIDHLSSQLSKMKWFHRDSNYMEESEQSSKFS